MTPETRKMVDVALPLMNIMLKQEEEAINRLFQEIKHGDAEHQKWLAKKLEDFFKVKVVR